MRWYADEAFEVITLFVAIAFGILMVLATCDERKLDRRRYQECLDDGRKEYECSYLLK